MIARSLIRRALSGWLRWRTTRKLYRALPEMRYFDMAEREAQKRHKNAEGIRAARKAFVTSCLREGR